MPSPANTSGLHDNHGRGTVADFLTAKIRDGSRLSVVSAYFTIYAYEALKQVLDHIEHMDFLFGEPSFSNRLDPDKTEKKSFLIDADGLRLANRLQQKRVARECADWIEHKVDIKTVTQSNLLHGKMYHVDNGGVEEAILGSSNFTVRGLGLGADGNNIELIAAIGGDFFKLLDGLSIATPRNGRSPLLFPETADADYQTMLQAIQQGKCLAKETPEADLPGFRYARSEP